MFGSYVSVAVVQTEVSRYHRSPSLRCSHYDVVDSLLYDMRGTQYSTTSLLDL